MAGVAVDRHAREHDGAGAVADGRSRGAVAVFAALFDV